MPSEGMQCEDCGVVWYSRVAQIIVRDPRLGRCVQCGGRLDLAENDEAPAGARVSAGG